MGDVCNEALETFKADCLLILNDVARSIEGMPQHYATAPVARLVEAANQVRHTVDRTTLLRVSTRPARKSRKKSRRKRERATTLVT